MKIKNASANLDIFNKFSLFFLFIYFYFDRVLGSGLKEEIVELGTKGLNSYLRVVFLIVFIFIYLIKIKRINNLPKKLKYHVYVCYGILVYFVCQLFFIPGEFIFQHLSGTVKYALLVFIYINFLLIIKNHSQELIDIISMIFALYFISIIIFYPALFFQYGISPTQRVGYLLSVGNEDSNAMVTLLPFLIWRVRKNPKLILLIFACTVFALLVNGTRTAQVLLMCNVILFLFFRMRKNFILLFISAIVIIFLYPMILEYFKLIFPKLFYDDIAMSFAKRQGQESLTNRIFYVWIPIIEYIVDNAPFFGLGCGSYDYVALQIGVFAYLYDLIYPEPAHNLFIHFLPQIGFIGVLFIVILFIKHFIKILKLMNMGGESIYLFTFISLFNFLIWSLLSNSINTYGLVVLLFLIISITALHFNKFEIPVEEKTNI